MTWYPAFRLGPSGSEQDFVCKVTEIQVAEGNIQVEQRNLAGAMARSYLRHNVPDVSLSLSMLTDAAMAMLRGFQSALAPLNFIFNSSLTVKYLPGTSETTTKVVIPLTSASGITITGVFLQSDPTFAGTNYYSGGSTFDATTGIITLASALPGANTDVFVNYTFAGLSCWAKVEVRPHRGVNSGLWEATLTLTGA